MKRIMIDTNIFDDLVSDPLFPDIYDALGKHFQFYSTPIQEREITNISVKRWKQLIANIPREVVPLVEVELDHMKEKHRADYQIAVTATSCTDVFLSNDKDLAYWIHTQYPEYPVWDYQQFINWLIQQNFLPDRDFSD